MYTISKPFFFKKYSYITYSYISIIPNDYFTVFVYSCLKLYLKHGKCEFRPPMFSNVSCITSCQPLPFMNRENQVNIGALRLHSILMERSPASLISPIKTLCLAINGLYDQMYLIDWDCIFSSYHQ